MAATPFMQEVISRWGETAPYWEKPRAIIREMFAPVTQALIEHAQLARRSTVLDAAAGPGAPALTVAALVGTKGRALGVRAVAATVEAARREALRRRLQSAA